MTETPDPFSSPEPQNNHGAWIVGVIVTAIAGLLLWKAMDAEKPAAVLEPERFVSATALPPADTNPMDQWIEWSATAGPGNYRVGGYSIEISTNFDADGLAVPKVRATDATGRSTELTGVGTTYGAAADFAVVQLDPADPVRQLLAASFSGGAHCCTQLVLLESRADGWRKIDLGSWDGGTPALPKDMDGDGTREFLFGDEAFNYAFDSYAGSWAPPMVHTVVDGRAVDVSKTAAFRPVFVRYAAEARSACLDQGNGACAAFVAASARAGRLDAAWAEMLGAYDQASEWILPTACRVRTAGACPTGAELTFSTFPEALQWFLGEHDYTDKAYVEPLNATGPSFDCGAARTPSERAICQSPDLAVLDRTLAVAYSRAMALSRDRAALRSSQREFHQARRDVSDTSVLKSLYEDRISELLSVD